MTLATLFSVLLRRWYATLLGLAVTLALVYVASTLVPATYQAQSRVLLLPPAAQTAAGANPYLALSGYQPFADVVANTMTDAKYVSRLRQQGVDFAYRVDRDLTTNGPVIIVSVVGGNSRQVIADLAIVTSAVPLVTQEIQQGGAVSVARRYQLTSEVIRQATRPSAVRKSQVRAELVALVAGLLASALLIAGLDRLAVRRRSRRSATAQARLTGEHLDGRADRVPDLDRPRPPSADRPDVSVGAAGRGAPNGRTGTPFRAGAARLLTGD